MKKILAIVLFSVFMTGGVFVDARSGCCSWHGGVRSDGCGCNDGSDLSATCAPYYSCSSGYSGSSYSPSYVPTTPTCPSMATYDSLSDSCKCMSGYVVGSSGSCVYGDTFCHQKYGYGSSYSSYDKTCSCDSGYQLDSNNQCVSNSTYCTSNFGYGAEYSYSKSKCVCSSGYVVDTTTNKCVYDTSATSYTPTTSYTPPATVCPANSYSSGSNCYCSEGYQINSTKDACVAKNPVPLDQQCKNYFGNDSVWDTQTSKCTIKIVVSSPSDSNVNTSTDTCKNTYGNGAYLKGEKCYCSAGYQWNTPVNKCIVSAMKINNTLREGSSGLEVVMLKNFLANQNLYSGQVNTAYDKETSLSVGNFQKLNGLPSTGIVSTLTRAKINSLMYKK